ncbi:uncharacterized protein LOC105844703 isoform X2 [Hydra vulgaris]|nr:protein ZINC INDUCED FACILITATOR-LIKE 1 [Hydra vulgaris]XP_047144877.1 protein ZINC INDUCED FACILITATOR-LIKE 1 [Hydra vulgaris]XP_047144878.1 protein ZINC INDUCED FACILITATOR-LIKE 1 [Hydra vulgaris]XP_047144879.1 protein ZINC INDUCED FACILITATOR-LIKE 1 [Hydra vulgaris]XP_047144880.1 protein ZINC INDUCED FACILITATOR-LIKE 1 [Hydra vulgaris]XP_047144881.1 protein ZINC INDUCED FACILITATOR-LIKE 1 [Hydra vulgaris]
MKITLVIKRIFYSEGSTPLPIKICFLLFTICLFNAISMTSVFSYLPHLVKDFGSTEVDAGRKSGIIASAMFVSRIFSSLLWGYICDKCGRKISLLMSGGCVAISTFMFGFSFNYPWAVVTRFLQGLSMGIVVITKAYMSDICDDSNLATGLGVVFSGYNVGLVIGPSMAGFLVFPVETYPKVFKKDSFFDTFKIFIPNFIIVLGMTLALLASIFVLPKKTYNDNDSLLIEDKKDSSMFNVDAYLNCSVDIELLKKSKRLQTSESTRLIDPKLSKLKKFWILLKMSSFFKLLRNKEFLISSMLYGLYTLFTIGYEELFPVFASTSIEYGGLGMSTSEIGLLYLVISITMFILQLVLVNKMINRFGSKKIFIVSSLIFGFLMPFIPLISVIKNKVFLWIILWINQVFIRVAMTSGFTAVNIFINNSVESDLLGIANGVGMSASSIGRSIGPASFGSLFTWSLANRRSFPFNQYFSFILILVVTIIVSLISLCVPESLNKKKIESVKKSTVTVTTSVFKL